MARPSPGTRRCTTLWNLRFERFAPEQGPPASGGGTLRDFGSHLVDQALVLLGPVESVYAEWRVRDGGPAEGLDDDVFLALTHAGGARAHLAGSWSEGAPGLDRPPMHGRGDAGAARADRQRLTKIGAQALNWSFRRGLA